MRKTIRILIRTLSAMLAFVALYMAFAFLLPHIHTGAEPDETGDSILVFITGNGVHTDIVMPDSNGLMNWNGLLDRSDFPGIDSSYHWLLAGWGDKGFYLNTPTWDDLTFSTAFKAVFGLSGTAMHIEYGKTPPFDRQACFPYRISAAHYRQLCDHVRSSFSFVSGRVQLIDAPGYWNNDRFYEAIGRYSLFRTCNTWTNECIRLSGHRSGVWTPFQSGIMQQFEK